MELDDFIKGRRSVRTYKDEHVPKEKIEAILEAGVWAGSGMNRQPWRFIVVEDKKTLKLISDETKKAARETPWISKRIGPLLDTDADVICYDAPALILVCTEANQTLDRLNLIDSVLAAQNMALKATELGLGTCYIGLIDHMNQNHPEVLKKAGVPDGYDMQVPLILGIPKSKQGLGKRNKPKILKWIK